MGNISPEYGASSPMDQPQEDRSRTPSPVTTDSKKASSPRRLRPRKAYERSSIPDPPADLPTRTSSVISRLSLSANSRFLCPIESSASIRSRCPTIGQRRRGRRRRRSHGRESTRRRQRCSQSIDFCAGESHGHIGRITTNANTDECFSIEVFYLEA